MSVPNAGMTASSTYIEGQDPLKGDVEFAATNTAAEDRPVAPDQFDPKYESTKKEIWSYYSYYVGNNGTTLFNFAPTLSQALLYEAAGDADSLYFFGANRTAESIVLMCNGISFAIQVVLFLILGSLADYGSWRPWILTFWSIVAFALGYAWLGVWTVDKWQVGIGLYMIGLIAYQMTITFWTAAFPGLARNTPELRKKAEEYEAGEITRDEYDFVDMMQRNRLQNVAFIFQAAGEIVILAILVGVLFAVDAVNHNDWSLAVLIAYCNSWWVVLAIPWFIFEKHRPGQKIPAGLNIVTVLPWTLWQAMTQIWELKQTLIYLIGYFVLGDSLNTTVTVVAVLQNSVTGFSSLTLTYLFIVGIVAELLGIWAFWTVQKRFKLSTKVMFNVVIVGLLLLDGWGMIGIWTTKFGFHNVWEFWLYQIWYGFFVCPWYSYSQIMISEVTPRGKEFLFFSLFSIMGKTSSFIGPIVSSAIIDASTSKNSSLPFYFLFGLTAASLVLLMFFVDLKKSRIEQAAFLAREAAVKERRASVISIEQGIIDTPVDNKPDTKKL